MSTDGLDTTLTTEVCAALERLGLVDYVSVVAGTSATVAGSDHIAPPMSKPNAYTAELSAAVRKAVAVPVLVAGRINQPQDAEQVLASGAADACAMTRALICDPDLPAKAATGRVEEIRACIACNQACMGTSTPATPSRASSAPRPGASWSRDPYARPVTAAGNDRRSRASRAEGGSGRRRSFTTTSAPPIGPPGPRTVSLRPVPSSCSSTRTVSSSLSVSGGAGACAHGERGGVGAGVGVDMRGPRRRGAFAVAEVPPVALDPGGRARRVAVECDRGVVDPAQVLARDRLERDHVEVRVEPTPAPVLSVTVQSPVPSQGWPAFQPSNVEPGAGTAVSRTALPIAKSPWQPTASQTMPLGELVTVPEPSPVARTSKRRVRRVLRIVQTTCWPPATGTSRTPARPGRRRRIRRGT